MSDFLSYNIFSNFIVDTLKCYAPKLEWSRNNEPIFRNNNFEIVRCNTGLQKCFGGCKHCMSVEGPLEVKSCAGDMDINLQETGKWWLTKAFLMMKMNCIIWNFVFIQLLSLQFDLDLNVKRASIQGIEVPLFVC